MRKSRSYSIICRKAYSLILAALVAPVVQAQYSGVVQTALADSVLTYSEFVMLVEHYHPRARVADIEYDRARKELLAARGAFDPVLFGNYRTKEYSNTTYYESLEGGIEVPTWMGIKLHAGYEDNRGQFLNPELRVPSAGLLHAGLSAQIGAGLLMDARRAGLRIAQTGVDIGSTNRTLLRNLLFFEATVVYYHWALTEQNLTVAREAVDLATIRYNAVRESYVQGDVPAIDTVEAYTQVLSRLFALREALSNRERAANMAEAFVWDENWQEVPIAPSVRPVWTEVPDPERLQMPLAVPGNHPELERFRLRMSQLNVEQRLVRQHLFPTVELKYNLLAENILPAPAGDVFADSRFLANNYIFGARVIWAIPMRRAMGQSAVLQLRGESLEMDRLNRRALLDADFNAALVRLANLREQINYARDNVRLLSSMLDAERTLFSLGESSLFLINARETALIQAQFTLFEMQAREGILLAEIRTIAGVGF